MSKIIFAENRQIDEYEHPKVVFKGVLKQFSGSPLGKEKGISLPGLSGQ